MTAFNRRDVEAALTRKGMEADADGKHVNFTRRTPSGFELKTHISHGSKSIGDKILSLIAKQCQLSNGEFRELVNCNIDEARWDELVAKREATGTLRYTGR